MKLLRLTTNDSECNFDNILNSDLIINPNSKIALSNASFTVQYPTIHINKENDTIKYNITDSDSTKEKTCVLLHGDYVGTTSSGLALLQDMSVKMNSKLTLDGKEFGSEWKVFQTTGTIEIQFQCFGNDFLSDDWDFQGSTDISGNDGDADRTLGMSTGASSDSDMSNRVVSKYKLGRGSSVFRGKIGELVSTGTDNPNNGFELVLVPDSVDDLGTPDLTSEQHKYSISVVASGTGFKYMYRDGTGTEKDPSLAPANFVGGNANNDVVEINISEGKLNGVVYQNTGTPETKTLFSVDYDGLEGLYPVYVFYGDLTSTKLLNPKTTLREGFSSSSPSLFTSQLGVPNPPSQRRSTVKLDMSNCQSLAKFLGFDQGTNNYVYSRPNSREIASFISEIGTFTYEYSDSYVVEYQSTQLESFDGFSKGQYSIIKVIPNNTSSIDDRKVNYDSNTLDFINMGNRDRMTVKNIKARILRSDLRPLETTHMSVMTLLIKDENE